MLINAFIKCVVHGTVLILYSFIIVSISSEFFPYHVLVRTSTVEDNAGFWEIQSCTKDVGTPIFCSPQHIHIAYGDSLQEMVILWATLGPCSTDVDFGTSPWLLDQHVVGTSTDFTEYNSRGLQKLHRAVLKGLITNTTYFYQPISNDISKGPFYFKTPLTSSKWSPEFLVFGDLGVHTNSIPTLSKEALRGEYTALLHIGDFAYNLRDEDGLVGDKFMQLIESVAVYLPYMTAPGNHEIDNETFSNYRHRFSMPGTPWPMPVNKLWYSFNVGPVHFISYSSEVFFTLGGSLVQSQYQWLVNDLTKANEERASQPWIIAFGHRPMYCSANNEDDCTKADSLVRNSLEELFYNFKVDLVLQAHEHNYERLYPVFKGVVLSKNYTNPPAPIQIISGAAGSKHGVDHFQQPSKPDWSAVRLEDNVLNSYGRLCVFNATHIYWEQKSVENATVLDALWVVREHRKAAFSDLSDRSGHENVTSIRRDGSSDSNSSKIMWELSSNSSNLQQEHDLQPGWNHWVLTLSLVIVAMVAVISITVMVVKVCQIKQRTAHRWDLMGYNYGKKLYMPSGNNKDWTNDPYTDVSENLLGDQSL